MRGFQFFLYPLLFSSFFIFQKKKTLILLLQHGGYYTTTTTNPNCISQQTTYQTSKGNLGKDFKLVQNDTSNTTPLSAWLMVCKSWYNVANELYFSKVTLKVTTLKQSRGILASSSIQNMCITSKSLVIHKQLWIKPNLWMF